MTALVWPTGRGSRWYGTCDICGQACREMFIRASALVVQTNTDGSAHMRPVAPWHYGHHACITRDQRHHINAATLPRVACPGALGWRVPAEQVRA